MSSDRRDRPEGMCEMGWDEAGMKAAAPAVPRIYGTFYLLGEEYAIEMSDLQEVVSAPEELQQMPRSPRYLMGLYNLRGRVLPVISMSLLLETRTAPEDQRGAKRLAVLRRGSALVGLLFDEIGKLIRVLPQELLAVAQHGVSGGRASHAGQAVDLPGRGQGGGPDPGSGRTAGDPQPAVDRCGGGALRGSSRAGVWREAVASREADRLCGRALRPGDRHDERGSGGRCGQDAAGHVSFRSLRRNDDLPRAEHSR